MTPLLHPDISAPFRLSERQFVAVKTYGNRLSFVLTHLLKFELKIRSQSLESCRTPPYINRTLVKGKKKKGLHIPHP
jgi:hypothetical protein